MKKAIHANLVGKTDISNDKQHLIIYTKLVSFCFNPTDGDWANYKL